MFPDHCQCAAMHISPRKIDLGSGRLFIHCQNDDPEIDESTVPLFYAMGKRYGGFNEPSIQPSNAKIIGIDGITPILGGKKSAVFISVRGPFSSSRVDRRNGCQYRIIGQPVGDGFN